MIELVNTRINQRWDLLLPPHRAERAEWWDGWEKERLSAMYDVIRPGDVIYDIGSEEGDLPALFAMWARGPSAERVGGVCLFEPNPKVWSNIRVIFEGNGVRPLDTFVGFAGDKTTHDFDLEIRIAKGFSDPQEGVDYTTPDFDWPECAYAPVIRDHGFCNLSERPDIPSITIDRHSASRGLVPDVITIDTEGSEYRVLKGAEWVLSEHHPIVFVSVHPAFMQEMYGDQPMLIWNLMGELGYSTAHLATDHEEHHVFWHPKGRQIQL